MRVYSGQCSAELGELSWSARLAHTKNIAFEVRIGVRVQERPV